MEQTGLELPGCDRDGRKVRNAAGYEVWEFSQSLFKRQPLYPVAKLKNHKDCVNAVAWAPLSW